MDEEQSQNDQKHGIVTFDHPHDDLNPQNWPTLYQWFIVLLLAFQAFSVTFTCTSANGNDLSLLLGTKWYSALDIAHFMRLRNLLTHYTYHVGIGIVPVANRVVQDLEGHENKKASVLFVTIWELGEAAGPLFIGPLSERYGRYPVFNVANALFICGIILTALAQDVGMVIFARFLTGCAVASNVLGPAVVGDILPSESRGKGMSAVMLAPLLGGAVGPAIAGAIAESSGWREILWMAAALSGACELAFLTLFRETYKIPILRRKAARLREETGDQSLRTEFDAGEKSWANELWKAVIRPVSIFTSSGILALMSIWGGMIFSFYYIMVTTLPDMLEDIYRFDAAMTGSAFLSFSVGSIIAILVCNNLVDKIYTAMRRRHADGRTYPEGRMPFVVVGAFCLPVTVALYGLVPQMQWSVWLLLLTVIWTGFFEVICMVPMLTYVTDAFGLYSASAFTAVLMTRCLMGTFLPLAAAPLTEALGYAYGFLILAGICLALAAVPLTVMLYGDNWRQRSEYTRDKAEE